MTDSEVEINRTTRHGSLVSGHFLYQAQSTTCLPQLPLVLLFQTNPLITYHYHSPASHLVQVVTNYNVCVLSV